MIKKVLYTLAILLFVLFSFLLVDYFRFMAAQEQQLLEKGKQNSTVLRDQVNAMLQNTMKEGYNLVDSISKNTYTKEALELLIKNATLKTQGALGVTVGFEPYGFDGITKFYCPYYDENKNAVLQIQDIYDYRDPSLSNAKWYTNIAKNQKAAWVEPYYAHGAKALVGDYGIPFYYTSGEQKGQLRGTVTMSISLRGFKKMIHKLSLGKAGFGFVNSPKGVILAHPNEAYIGNKTIHAFIKEEPNPELKKAYQSLLDGQSDMLRYKDASSKEEKLFFYDQVTAASWGIGVVFFKNDMIPVDTLLKRKYIHLAIVLGLLAFVLLAIYYTRDFLSISEIWYLSYFSVAVLIAIAVLVGYLQHSFPDVVDMEEDPMITLSEVANFVDDENNIAAINKNTPWVEVPTGIYIDELEFEDEYNINISGLIWQRFDTLTVKKYTPGFRFPQVSPFAEASYIEETTRHYEKDKVLIHYEFRSTVRLPLDYSDYPFDKRNIHLEIEPLDFKDRLLLIPDLHSYDNTAPSKKSGINTEIELPGDKILESYFSYIKKHFTTDFGYIKRDYYNSVPVLQYNIKIRRVLITSFVTYLIPVFVTLIMIFIMIKATRKPKKKDVDGGGIVQGMAAFFFVLIFSHIDLRKDIVTGDLIYMEYFYFVSYAMIILATYNLITYTRIAHRIFDYKDNIIVRAIYWPTFFLMVLLITLFKFY